MFNAAKVGISAVSGTADNCECIHRDMIVQEASAKYLLLDETPFIFLKSAKSDHIFTDKAYICVVGQSAVGTKRTVWRADYAKHAISNVMFESAGMGMTDQDCELKFSIGGNNISIDIRKSDAEMAILYYRLLSALVNAQAQNGVAMTMFKDMNGKLTYQINGSTATSLEETLRTAYTVNLANSQEAVHLMAPASYKGLFEQYLGR